MLDNIKKGKIMTTSNKKAQTNMPDYIVGTEITEGDKEGDIFITAKDTEGNMATYIYNNKEWYDDDNSGLAGKLEDDGWSPWVDISNLPVNWTKR